MKIPKSEFRVLDAKMGRPLRIVADGSISSQGIMSGRLVPVLILDTSERPDVEEWIRIHYASQLLGDVIVQWGQLEGKDKTVILCLTSKRPTELLIVIEFKVVEQGILIDQALQSRGMYIQAGRDGDRVKHDVNRPKVLVEIGDAGYGQIWEMTWKRELVKSFRDKRLGRSEARKAATLMIQELRAFGKSLRKRDKPM